MESTEPQGEERRRRVRKRRRVTKVMVDGKEVSGDFLKNPSSLEFPDPGRRFRKYLIAGIILVALLLSSLLFLKVSDFMPSKVGAPELER